MNLRKLALIAILMAGAGVAISVSDPAYGLSRGPFLERTGAPEEQTCVTCHRTYPLDSGPGRVEIIGLPAQYQPSQVYPISVRITDPLASRWGFQITAITDDGAAAGFFQTTTPGVQALGPSMRLGRFYAEHTILGNYDGQRGTAEWPMNWKAPSSDLGPVTFYAAGNAANGDQTDFFDYIYTTNLTIDGQKRIVRVSLSDPTSHAVIGSGEKTTIRWSATAGDTGGPVSFRITLSTDGGENYPSVIVDNLPGDARSFVWSVPDALVTDMARLRVTAVDPEGLEHSATSSANLSVRKLGLDVHTGLLPAAQGVSINDIAVADYNGDGLADAAFARAGGGVLLARQSQTGALEDVTSASGIADSSIVHAVAWGDMDGDGQPDLAVASVGSTAVYRNLGAGQFENVGTPTSLPRPANPRQIVWADLDRDGHLDLVIATADGVIALRNTGDGDFVDATAALGISAQPVSAVAAGPLLALGGQNGVRLLRFDGTRYSDVTAAVGVSVAASTNSIAWLDLTGDGRLDLVLATASGLRVFKGLGGQGVRFVDAGASLGFPTNGADVQRVAAGDYDADGDLDLFLVLGSGTTIVERNNNGSSFELVTDRFTLADHVKTAMCVDLDNSGAVDLVTVGESLDAYTNPRSGGTALSVRPVVPNAGAGAPRDAVGATVRLDFDGDGDWSTGQQVAEVVTGAGLPILFNVPGGGVVDARVDFAGGQGRQASASAGPAPIVVEQPEAFKVTAVKIGGTADTPKMVVDGSGLPATGARIEVDDTPLALVKAPKKKVLPDGTTTRLTGKDGRLGSLTASRPVAVRVVNPATGVVSTAVLLQ